jgi:hypothetical protein
MNIEKLEQILREMETVKLASPEETELVRRWAEGIQAAITEHLMEQLQGSTPLEAPNFSSQPGGHGWNEDET